MIRKPDTEKGKEVYKICRKIAHSCMKCSSNICVNGVKCEDNWEKSAHALNFMKIDNNSNIKNVRSITTNKIRQC